jgi:hypothetical protein
LTALELPEITSGGANNIVVNPGGNPADSAAVTGGTVQPLQFSTFSRRQSTMGECRHSVERI